MNNPDTTVGFSPSVGEPGYLPYCGRCTGLIRMTRAETEFVCKRCGNHGRTINGEDMFDRTAPLPPATGANPMTSTTVRELVERAMPLLECGHRCNRPNERQKGERVVGFVIGEDDIGLGLSEPLFALEAVVELAKIASSLQKEIDAYREALEPSGDTKAAYMGEFSFDIEVADDTSPETDYVRTMRPDVPWTTIKEIMAAIRNYAALKARANLNDKSGEGDK